MGSKLAWKTNYRQLASIWNEGTLHAAGGVINELRRVTVLIHVIIQ